MTLKQYLTFMGITTIICWAVWILTIFYFDPTVADSASFLLFYTSLFAAVVGTISVVGFLFQWRIMKIEDVAFKHVRRTFRRGIIYATFIVLTLILSSLSLLTWWNVTMLVLILAFIEGVIFSKRKYNNRDYV